jgi:hypothetical protein
LVVKNSSPSFLSPRRSNENKDIAQTEEVKQTAGDAPVEVVRKFRRTSVVFSHRTRRAVVKRLPRKTAMSCSRVVKSVSLMTEALKS